MRFLRQSLAGVFLASLTAAMLLYAGQMIFSAVKTRMSDQKRPPPARERVFAVNVVTARYETVTPILEAFGEVQSRRTLELRAAHGGRVVELSADFVEGGSVSAGDVLAKIDPANAQAALDRAESDLLDARAEGRDAERALHLARDELAAAQNQTELRMRAYRRQQDLADRGVGTAAAVEAAELSASSARQAVLSRRQAVAQAEARVDQAATRLARAQISRNDAQRTLGDTTVRATFDGSLSDVNVVEGRLVSLNEKLASLVDPHALEAVFRVSTAQYVRLLDENGTLIPAQVKVTLDLAGAELKATGRISRDSVSVGEGSLGRLIFAQLDKAPGFKPGDFVTVAVEEPEIAHVARLPASALDASGTILALDAEERLESLDVELIRRQGDAVLVRGGGLNGREIVVGRTPLLGAGIRVRPLRMEEGASQSQEPELVALSDEQRAKLVTFIEANDRMPAEAKERVLNLLEREQVPVRLVKRIEARMGG